MNPWGLTPAEVKAMDAVIEAGSDKQAAYRLGLSGRTVERQLLTARKRMGVHLRLHALLAWDRWRQNVELSRQAGREGA